MFFTRSTVKLPRELHAHAAARAKELNLPSADAYVASLLERDAASHKEQTLREQVVKQMKSLGYME